MGASETARTRLCLPPLTRLPRRLQIIGLILNNVSPRAISRLIDLTLDVVSHQIPIYYGY